jgi:2-polyprenyl-3-methyl-5-hydroxy-6-metoxy-1,4-benzoquinol methylase
MNDTKDHFAHKAKDYEKETRRVDNVKNIANGILKNINFNKNMHILDFGSGTGLLTSQIAPYVNKITAIDMSQSMNEVLKQKISSYPCELEVLQMDLSEEQPQNNYDCIISSMTIHHVKDIKKLFEIFYNLLKPNGTIALADLEPEDGTFHSTDTGVFHFGFDKNEFLNIAKEAGFKDLQIDTVSVAKKPYGDFPIFLLTGKK